MGDHDDRDRGDSFLGYKLRTFEETLQATHAAIRRVERKIDALGSGLTPADITKAIAAITADTAKIDQAADSTNRIADQLDQTGV